MRQPLAARFVRLNPKSRPGRGVNQVLPSSNWTVSRSVVGVGLGCTPARRSLAEDCERGTSIRAPATCGGHCECQFSHSPARVFKLVCTLLLDRKRIPLREWPYRADRPGCGQSTVALNRSGSGLLSFLRPRTQVAWIRKRGHAERELEQALVERIIETL
jgi:hypothetical protein